MCTQHPRQQRDDYELAWTLPGRIGPAIIGSFQPCFFGRRRSWSRTRHHHQAGFLTDAAGCSRFANYKRKVDQEVPLQQGQAVKSIGAALAE